MTRIVFAAFAAVLGIVPATRAASIVSEAEFLSVLTADHPAIVATQSGVAQARAAELATRALENPEVTAIREDPSGISRQLDLTFSWQLPGRDRRPLRDSAGRRVLAEEARAADIRLDVRRELRQVYAAWATASAEAELLSRHIATLDLLAQRERERAQRGEASGLEASRLELAVAELRAQAALAGADVAAATATARGWSSGMASDAAPSLPALPPMPAHLPSSHPQLTALEHDVEAATLARKAAGRVLVLPEVTAGWQRLEAGPMSTDGPIVGVTWPLPLANRKQSQRAGSEARLRTTEARLAAARSRIGAERQGAQDAYRQLAAAVSQARRALDGRGMVAGVEAAFRSGESSLTDLLETLRSVRSAELTVLGLHAAALEAHRELERLVGAPLALIAPEDDAPPGDDR